MMRTIFSTLLLMAIANSAWAMMLNPRGLGQVLVFPYYTVNGNNSTLLTIANSSADGKALKLRFHEGYDGRGVLDLNIYLGPFDTWTGQVVDIGGAAADGATLITSDASCTVPTLAPLANHPGLRALDFSGASYAGANTSAGPTGNSDGGPLTLDRTREGHFDVLEMGVLSNASHNSLSAATAKSASGCQQLVDAWSSGGYWQVNPTTDLAAPSGGLYGNEGVIDIQQGFLYAVNAAAIDGFSTTIQHTAPGSAAPDLNTASATGGLTAAFVAVDGKMLELDYARPIDAVSALFMTDVLSNDFNKASELGATSDWIVTAPTKRFYVDPTYIGTSAQPPFQKAFGSNYTTIVLTSPAGTQQSSTAFPYSCVFDTPTVYSREGGAYLVNAQEADGFFVSASLTPCAETSVLTFATVQKEFLGGSFAVPFSALGSQLTVASDPSDSESRVFGDVDSIPFAQGYMRLDLSHDGTQYYSFVNPPVVQQYLSAASNGDVLYGLPVIGFLAVNFVNANVTPGVLANYSGAYPHHGSVRCANASTPGNACK